MARGERPRRGAVLTTRKASVLDRLKPEESANVLRRLLAAYPDLGAEAEEIARSLLGEVSFESVTGEVEDAVRALALDDLNNRAGPHRWGYTEPSQAAWDLLEEAVEPFLEDMERNRELGLRTDALEICKGVVLALYRLRNEPNKELLGWAPDFPAETAAWAVDRWRASGRRKKASKMIRRQHPVFPKEFLDEFVPE